MAQNKTFNFTDSFTAGKRESRGRPFPPVCRQIAILSAIRHNTGGDDLPRGVMTMQQTLTLKVNGRDHSVTTDPDRPLLDVLREDLELTGAKYGCGERQCGACTVLVEGRPVFSCSTRVGTVADRPIRTIEGVAEGDALHPVQAAFLAHGALQCGYCTTGMVMTAVSLLEEKPHPTAEEIRQRMQRNVCRCGTYVRILAAIQQAAGSSEQVGAK
jgi:aerobic-type carbon monoxide dehydrogenase small subunit (CoxS/CutS family)